MKKRTCDRCGFDYREHELRRQKGMYLSDDCYDFMSKADRKLPRWMSPRDHGDTTTAVNSPTVFTITTSGVTTLSNSNQNNYDGRHSHFFMFVVSSGGAVDISSNPQIVSSQDSDRLTLQGTSDTDTIKLDDGAGLALFKGNSFTLKNGYSITLVYNSSTGLWQETSRFEGGTW